MSKVKNRMNKSKYSSLIKLPLALLIMVGVSGAMISSPLAIQSAWAQEEEDPGELARESLELMMKSLGLVIDAIPQYEMPVINDNGDIIIRRKQKDDWEDEDENPEVENEDDEDSPKQI